MSKRLIQTLRRKISEGCHVSGSMLNLAILALCGRGVRAPEADGAPSRRLDPPRVVAVRLLSGPKVARYGIAEYALEVAGRCDDPYDPAKFALDARVVAPSGRRLTVPGFLYQAQRRTTGRATLPIPISSTDALAAGKAAPTRTTDDAEILVPVGKPEWRVRFAPVETGTYRLEFAVRNPQGTARADGDPERRGGEGRLRTRLAARRAVLRPGRRLALLAHRRERRLGGAARDPRLRGLASEARRGGRELGAGLALAALGHLCDRAADAWDVRPGERLAARRGARPRAAERHPARPLHRLVQHPTRPRELAGVGAFAPTPPAEEARRLLGPTPRRRGATATSFATSSRATARTPRRWAGSSGTRSTAPPTTPPRPVLDWHARMAAYLHGIDPYGHPVTTSFGGNGEGRGRPRGLRPGGNRLRPEPPLRRPGPRPRRPRGADPAGIDRQAAFRGRGGGRRLGRPLGRRSEGRPGSRPDLGEPRGRGGGRGDAVVVGLVRRAARPLRPVRRNGPLHEGDRLRPRGLPPYVAGHRLPQQGRANAGRRGADDGRRGLGSRALQRAADGVRHIWGHGRAAPRAGPAGRRQPRRPAQSGHL